MTAYAYCKVCKDDTEHTETYTDIPARWQDSAISDDELDHSELIERMNGDSLMEVTQVCNVCGNEKSFILR
jgi:thymidine kinase